MPMNLVWDKPVDPQGDCKFQNAGGKLTITVAGKRHDLSVEGRRMTCAATVADVEGNFMAQVARNGRIHRQIYQGGRIAPDGR